MKRFSILKTALLAAAPLLLASCTVEEPNPDYSSAGSGSSQIPCYYDSYRLSSVDNVSFTYGNVVVPTLPTEITEHITDVHAPYQRFWTLAYNSDSRLSSITVRYTEHSENSNRPDFSYGSIDVTETWKNIVLNDNGAILSADIETYKYGEYYDNNYNPTTIDETTVSNASFSYNTKGELTSRSIGELTLNYVWENGNLTSAELENGSTVEYTYSDYNDILNTARRWDPCQPFVNILQHFGFFGVGPRQFMKSVTVYSDGYSESARFVYEVEQSAFKQRTLFEGTSTNSGGTIYYNYERYYTL